MTYIPLPAVIISSEHQLHMRVHLEANLPEEACGILVGKDNLVQFVLPLTNTLHSPVRYRIDPQEQFDAFQWMEQRELDLLGIFHSHPAGPGEPSPTDIAEAYYPECAYLIWSKAGGEWKCRAFWIHDNHVSEISLQFTDAE